MKKRMKLYIVIRKSKSAYSLKIYDSKKRLRDKIFIDNITEEQKDIFKLSKVLYLLFMMGYTENKFDIDEQEVDENEIRKEELE